MLQRRKTSIILADDHEVYLDGLSALLSREPDFDVADTARNATDLIEKVKQKKPEVAVVDLSMGGLTGIEAIRKITGKTSTRCLAHTFHNHTFIIQDALDSGATGFVVKNAQRGEITKAIRALADNRVYCCPITESVLAKALAASRFNPKVRLAGFSDREVRIIFMICQEKTSDEISRELFLSKRTVEGLRRRLLAKMKVKTSAGMLFYALKNHLFSLEDLDNIK
jgi:DNA-binding NarL/FixJ family response regulator